MALAVHQTKCQLLQQGKLSPHLALTHTDSLSFLSQGPPHASSPSSTIPLCSPADSDTLAVPLPDTSHLFKLFPSQSLSEGRQHAWLRNSSKHIQTEPFRRSLRRTVMFWSDVQSDQRPKCGAPMPQVKNLQLISAASLLWSCFTQCLYFQ